MSVKDVNQGGGGSENLPLDVQKVGYLKKFKTMKKKFFVLKIENAQNPACLEYYDSEKKWRAGVPPKRNIALKNCFNINRKMDAKQKHVIALYTKDDCFAVVADNEQEEELWLTALLSLQGKDGEMIPKPTFDHIWQVTVRPKGLGTSKNILGSYRLCLSSSCLNLVKMGAQADSPENLKFPLMTVRRCGHSDNYFFMELGRSSVTGQGELWMQTDDTIIAHNMHEAILNAMKRSTANSEEFRHRSNSTNEKPINHRRPAGKVPPQPWNDIRGRCSTMPSRTRTVSEGYQDISLSSSTKGQFISPSHLDSFRSHSVSSRPMSYSPPAFNAYSIGSTDSVGSGVSEDDNDYHHMQFSQLTSDGMLPTEPTITEETLEESFPSLRTKNFPLHLNLQNAVPDGSPSHSEYIVMTSPLQVPEGQEKDYVSMDKSQIITSDGYVPMAPLGAREIPRPPQDYIDMTPASSSAPKSIPSSMDESSRYLDMTSPQHSIPSSLGSSFTQEEFHLDKVKSYFSPSADMEYMKPIRTYSMGSHPHMRKPHLTAQVEPVRARAYSVGSPNKGKQPIEKELGVIKNIDRKASQKSTSAPQLPPQSRGSSRTANHNEDLMEIDYNQPYSEDDLAKMAQKNQPEVRKSSSQLSSSSEKMGSSSTSLLTKTGQPVVTTAPANISHPISFSHSGLSGLLTSVSSNNDTGSILSSSEKENSILNSNIQPLIVTNPSQQPAKKTDYMDMTLGVSSSESSLHGDYVNLDLSRTTTITQTPHDYVNIQFPKVAPEKSCLKPSNSPMVKQMSIPEAASSLSHLTEPTSSPRKGSCPTPLSSASSSSSIIKSSDENRANCNAQEKLLTPHNVSLENLSTGVRPSMGMGINRELHYAALDLAPANEEVPRSPRALPLGSNAPLMYAQIDFFKSEGLKQRE